MIHALFPIDPVAWARAGRGRTHSYTLDHVASFKGVVQAIARRSHTGKPLHGALHLTVTFYRRPPTGKKRVHPTTKPDLDNYVKGVMDALNGIFWVDDAQICKAVVEKRYAKDVRSGRIELAVARMEDDHAA
jgi:Holliday junction resolvase RusA-like endonuclease